MPAPPGKRLGGDGVADLSRCGQVTPEPKKRPHSSYIRFQAELPNQMWQTDFTHYRLAGGQHVEILNEASLLDDRRNICPSHRRARTATVGP
jgi:transposase InsO family protein